MKLSLLNEAHPFVTTEYDGHIVQIDKQLYPIIRRLWAGGYKTGGCCQGGAYYSRDRAKKQKAIKDGRYDPWRYHGYISFEYSRDDDQERSRVERLVRAISREATVKVEENMWDRWNKNPSSLPGSLTVMWPDGETDNVLGALDKLV